MRNNLRNIFFILGLHNHRSDMWIWHDKTLSAIAHPSEVSLQRNGILLPQALAVNPIYHVPSTYKFLTMALRILLIVEHNALYKHVVNTISSSIAELA